MNLEITSEKEIKVNNIGLEKSKPIITLYGEGTIDFYVNGLEIFKINIDDGYAVIDSLNEEAYKENVLKNRCMVGEFPEFLSGDLKKLVVYSQSRWL